MQRSRKLSPMYSPGWRGSMDIPYEAWNSAWHISSGWVIQLCFGKLNVIMITYW